MANVGFRKCELRSKNPAPFADPYEWLIELDVSSAVKGVIDCQVVFIPPKGSSDQILDEFELGPLSEGITRVPVEHRAPRFAKIPPEDILGLHGILISFSIKGQEFLIIGNMVNIDFSLEEHNMNPPAVMDPRLLRRKVDTKCTVTRKDIAPIAPEVVAPPKEGDDEQSSEDGDTRETSPKRARADQSAAPPSGSL